MEKQIGVPSDFLQIVESFSKNQNYLKVRKQFLKKVEKLSKNQNDFISLDEVKQCCLASSVPPSSFTQLISRSLSPRSFSENSQRITKNSPTLPPTHSQSQPNNQSTHFKHKIGSTSSQLSLLSQPITNSDNSISILRLNLKISYFKENSNSQIKKSEDNKVPYANFKTSKFSISLPQELDHEKQSEKMVILDLLVLMAIYTKGTEEEYICRIFDIHDLEKKGVIEGEKAETLFNQIERLWGLSLISSLVDSQKVSKKEWIKIGIEKLCKINSSNLNDKKSNNNDNIRGSGAASVTLKDEGERKERKLTKTISAKFGREKNIPIGGGSGGVSTSNNNKPKMIRSSSIKAQRLRMISHLDEPSVQPNSKSLKQSRKPSSPIPNTLCSASTPSFSLISPVSGLSLPLLSCLPSTLSQSLSSVNCIRPKLLEVLSRPISSTSVPFDLVRLCKAVKIINQDRNEIVLERFQENVSESNINQEQSQQPNIQEKEKLKTKNIIISEILESIQKETGFDEKSIQITKDEFHQRVHEEGDMGVQVKDFFEEKEKQYNKQGETERELERMFLGIVRTINQEMIFPPIIQMRTLIYSSLPYKDEKGTWKVNINFRNSDIIIIHKKKERAKSDSPTNYFSFQWKYIIRFDRNLQNLRYDFFVKSYEFNEETDEETKNSFSLSIIPLLSPTLFFEHRSNIEYGLSESLQLLCMMIETISIKNEHLIMYQWERALSLTENIYSFLLSLSECLSDSTNRSIIKSLFHMSIKNDPHSSPRSQHLYLCTELFNFFHQLIPKTSPIYSFLTTLHFFDDLPNCYLEKIRSLSHPIHSSRRYYTIIFSSSSSSNLNQNENLNNENENENEKRMKNIQVSHTLRNICSDSDFDWSLDVTLSESFFEHDSNAENVSNQNQIQDSTSKSTDKFLNHSNGKCRIRKIREVEFGIGRYWFTQDKLSEGRKKEIIGQLKPFFKSNCLFSLP